MQNMFNESLRHEYDLNSDSVVFDIGGFRGEWSHIIYDKYKPVIYCFEPVFTIVSNVIPVYDYGLGAKSEKLTIKMDRDKTGRFCKTGIDVDIEIVDIMEFIRLKGITHIDLMKINIEGMEYELLNRLIDCGWIRNIDNIQVQFHNITPTSDRDMFCIQQQLRKTHSPTWQYRYIWENWKRNGTDTQ